MKNLHNNAPKAQVALNAIAAEQKTTFASADLWNIHNMLKSRVYRRYL
jgi:hypothetical protein